MRYVVFVVSVAMMFLVAGALQQSALAKVNGVPLYLQVFEQTGTGWWNARGVAPPTGGNVPTSIGDGWDCDRFQFQVCRDNKIVYTITEDGETNVVTVNFSQQVYLPYFADGRNRAWVPIPPATSITVDSISEAGSSANVDAVFADINPNVDAQGLLPPRYDIADPGDPEDTPQLRDYGNYSAGETVTFPATFSEDGTFAMLLRTTNSYDSVLCGTSAIIGNCPRVYVFGTMLMTMPDGFGRNHLRAPIGVNGSKPLFNVDTDIDLTRFLNTALTTAPTDYEAIKRRWSHTTEALSVGDSINGSIHSEGGRGFRNNWLTHNYASNHIKIFYDDLLAIGSSTAPLAEKKEAVYAMLAYSMDTFFAVFNCDETSCTYIRPFLGGAGQGPGKGPAAAVFATVAVDPKYRNSFTAAMTGNVGHGFPDSPDPFPQVGQEWEQTNNGIWGDFPDDLGTLGNWSELVRRYWSAMLARKCHEGGQNLNPADPTACSAGTGKRTSRDPYNQIDGAGEKPSPGYMQPTAGPYRTLAVLMEIWPEYKAVINWQPIIDYAKRLHYTGLKALPDTCAPPDPRESASCDPWVADTTGANCDWALFTAGDTIQVTYGPHPNDPTQCVPNSTTCTDPQNGNPWDCVAAQPGDPNYGQNGRFSSFHGVQIAHYNTSPQAEAIFEQVIPNN